MIDWIAGKTNCWSKCGSKSGSCSACGKRGYCCRSGYHDGDCPSQALAMLEHITDIKYHTCVREKTSSEMNPEGKFLYLYQILTVYLERMGFRRPGLLV